MFVDRKHIIICFAIRFNWTFPRIRVRWALHFIEDASEGKIESCRYCKMLKIVNDLTKVFTIGHNLRTYFWIHNSIQRFHNMTLDTIEMKCAKGNEVWSIDGRRCLDGIPLYRFTAKSYRRWIKIESSEPPTTISHPNPMISLSGYSRRLCTYIKPHQPRRFGHIS